MSGRMLALVTCLVLGVLWLVFMAVRPEPLSAEEAQTRAAAVAAYATLLPVADTPVPAPKPKPDDKPKEPVAPDVQPTPDPKPSEPPAEKPVSLPSVCKCGCDEKGCLCVDGSCAAKAKKDKEKLPVTVNIRPSTKSTTSTNDCPDGRCYRRGIFGWRR